MRQMQYLFDTKIWRVKFPGILTGQILFNGPLGEGVSSPTKVDTVAKSMIKCEISREGSETVGTVVVSTRETKLMLSHWDASDIIV